MEILGGILVFVIAVVVYPLLLGALYYLFTAGPVWLFRYILGLIYDNILFPLLKTFTVVPGLGKCFAYLLSLLIVLVVSAVCLFAITLPFVVLSLELLQGKDCEPWDDYPVVSFYRMIFGGFAEFFRLTTFEEPDPLISTPLLSTPIAIGKVLFEIPFFILAVLSTLMIPIKSFFWLGKSWTRIALD